MSFMRKLHVSFGVVVLALILVAILPSWQHAPTGNTAIIAAGKLEKDFYDWDQRHAAVMAIKDAVKPEVVLIGDSITHLWGGVPEDYSSKGNRGTDSWKTLFRDRSVLNLGFGWDRTQNVLKRIELGELDGLSPKAIVLLIGTNNLTSSKNARENTPTEIAEGIGVILEKSAAKCPQAQIILMAVFPRGEKPNNPDRAKIAAINGLIAKFATKPQITFLDLTAKLTNADASISKDVLSDFLHPSAKGYAIWAEALRPVLPY
jgi:lysophospholipase L1-like esterase